MIFRQLPGRFQFSGIVHVFICGNNPDIQGVQLNAPVQVFGILRRGFPVFERTHALIDPALRGLAVRSLKFTNGVLRIAFQQTKTHILNQAFQPFTRTRVIQRILLKLLVFRLSCLQITQVAVRRHGQIVNFFFLSQQKLSRLPGCFQRALVDLQAVAQVINISMQCHFLQRTEVGGQIEFQRRLGTPQSRAVNTAVLQIQKLIPVKRRGLNALGLNKCF